MSLGSPLAEILAGLLAFLIGGVPFGWLYGRVVRGVDLRIQEMQQQAMQEVQQQMSQQAEMSQMYGAEQPTAEGTDMRAGGTPYALANPGGTREALTGQTASGGQVMQ